MLQELNMELLELEDDFDFFVINKEIIKIIIIY